MDWIMVQIVKWTTICVSDDFLETRCILKKSYNNVWFIKLAIEKSPKNLDFIKPKWYQGPNLFIIYIYFFLMWIVLMIGFELMSKTKVNLVVSFNPNYKGNFDLIICYIF